MTRTTILALLVSGALSLSGCGGGGGGGGGSSSSSGGGSSSSSSSGGNGGTFTVTATTVSLAAKRMTTPPAAIIVTANVNDSRTAAVGAAYRPGVTPAAWLDVGLVQINPQRYEFSFEVNSTGTALAAGTYTTTVAVGSTDASGNVLHSRDIAVTLVVREGVRFQFNGFGAQGTAGSNWMLPTQVVSVIAPPNTQWTLTSGVPWMSVPPGTRTGSVDVTVTMDPSTLPGGNFEGLLTATNVTDATDNSTSRAFFNVLANCPSYSIKEFVNPGIVGGTSGLDHGPMPVYFNLGSGTNQFGWSVTGPTWLHFDTTSGMVSSAETHFSVSADLSQLSPGEHTGTLELQSHV
ncbi:MAG TPA: hypothetical protein VM146_08450, partial [Steroidobacteraceae bacterium]|nr:hypothetical protein [Steroidobacteraceae bacterium]